MKVPARGGGRFAQHEPGDSDRGLSALRARWRRASLASGWRFPGDWALPEVDAVCMAVLRDGKPDVPLARLARARAAAGADLAETLVDLAALHAVLAEREGLGHVSPDIDSTPSRLLRVAALAWADVATGRLADAGVIDPLTGLPSAAYLRTRLGELYRLPARGAAADHTLLVVSMNLSEVAGWPRLTAMILLGDALRTVFDGGETLASLGPSTAAALLPRDGRVMSRVVLLRRTLCERLSVDTELDAIGAPRLRMLRLPATHESACEFVSHLGRA